MMSKHFLTLMRLCFIFVVIVAIVFSTGCASTGAAKADSPTGGISLEMSITGKDNFAAIYRVEQDGTIHFGGGMDARINKTSWEGQLTELDIKQLTDLLNKHGWFNDLPSLSTTDEDRNYDIQLRWPGGRNSFKISGKSPAVAPVEDLLAQFANRRHDVFLESLPKATEPPD